MRLPVINGITASIGSEITRGLAISSQHPAQVGSFMRYSGFKRNLPLPISHLISRKNNSDHGFSNLHVDFKLGRLVESGKLWHQFSPLWEVLIYFRGRDYYVDLKDRLNEEGLHLRTRKKSFPMIRMRFLSWYAHPLFLSRKKRPNQFIPCPFSANPFKISILIFISFI